MSFLAMNKNIMLIEEDWGCLDLNISFRKVDILPRITVSDMTGAWILNIGFLAFTLNLVILDEVGRMMNREVRRRRNGTLR